ncbi:MAG: hypothetical protein P8182_10940 [Deltaproteobacteria bacterium]
MKIAVAVIVAILVLPGTLQAKSCRAMRKELAELRREYHEYANSGREAAEPVTFEKLAEMLDKIIELKRGMRESNCKIPPREKDIQRKP